MPRSALKLSPISREAIRRARRRFLPRESVTNAQWAEKYRMLAGGWLPGAFRFENQPALKGIVEAADDPAVREIWGGKSSQFGWTQGVELNIILRRVHVDPCPILVLFPKESAAKRFMREKVVPAIEATPELAAIIQTARRGPDNSQDYKKFPGGFLQLIASNSPANIKSTDAPLVIVEEPDDTSTDVKGQGDSVAMARERLKSYGEESLLIVGGTMTLQGLSKVEAGLKKTDQRRYYVSCPHCQHEQTLRWEQVTWLDNASVAHQVYGTYRPETARYRCEAEDCGALWSDAEKNQAILAAMSRPDRGWRATAPFNGLAGFYINDLISTNPGASLQTLTRLFLEAQHLLRQGDDRLMRSFVNNQLGETWRLKNNAPEVVALTDRAEDYPNWTTPGGGLVATAAVDVQRGGADIEAGLHVKIKTWGRGEESWLVAYFVVPGNPLELAVWDELDVQFSQPIRNLAGGQLGLSAVSIDSSDGMTQEAVYRYCRLRRHVGYMAIKGDPSPHKEIFTPPSQSIDTTTMDKAAKWGLKLYRVGKEKALDLIYGRIALTGNGPGRMHWHKETPPDYFRQLTSQVRAPSRNGKIIWQTQAGMRSEAIHLEMYALHAARKMRLHTWTEADWVQQEIRVRQGDLLKSPQENQAPVTVPAAGPRGTSAPTAQPFTGFGEGRRLL